MYVILYFFYLSNLTCLHLLNKVIGIELGTILSVILVYDE